MSYINRQFEPKIVSAVIRADSGKTYEGRRHNEAIQKAEASGDSVSHWNRERDGMFKISDGRLLHRDATQKEFGVRYSEEVL